MRNHISDDPVKRARQKAWNSRGLGRKKLVICKHGRKASDCAQCDYEYDIQRGVNK